MKEQSEMLRQYKKLQRKEKKIMKKESLTDDDLQDLFNLRQDMALILDYLDPQYSDQLCDNM